MPLDWIPVLARHCAERGLDFLSTPFDENAADALDAFVPAFKIASYEMTHYPLLQHVARKGKPLIVSTGAAELDEVRDMIAAVRAVADPGLIVLQCTAKYPAPLSALNLCALASIAQLGVLIGLSDHSREPLPGPLGAVALGAVLLEKHFTLSNDLPGPDHAYALEPHELKELIARVRELEAALGAGDKRALPEEQELRAFARRTIFTTRALVSGDRLRRADLAVLRSGNLPYGLHPKEYLHLFGRVVERPLAAEFALRMEDVGPLRLGHGEVTLRPMEEQDTARIVAWRARPEVADQFFSERGPTIEEHEQWFRGLVQRSDRIEFVILQAQLGPVGTVGLSNIDFAANRAEYGVMLGESAARGRGLASQASSMILEYAFDVLGLDQVRLSAFADNAAALRLYERLGFLPSPEKAPARMKGGVLRPVLDMFLNRGSWKR
jgi:sialic acid synthase SpsE/RimJ/RimL family protein N-acetyltransferase